LLLPEADEFLSPTSRKSGDQYLHRKTAVHRDAVRRTLAAYHRHIQLGLVAQGVLQLLAATVPALIWRSFGSWLRTIRPGLASSEQVVTIALRHRLPHFLGDEAHASLFTKFLRARIDVTRSEGIRLVA